MANAQLSPPSYLKYAFEDQHNLVVLFGAACFSLAFASLVPLYVGAGAELLWLSIGSRLPTFRGWVDRRISTQYLARAEAAIEGALAELSERDAKRYRALGHDAKELVASAHSRLSARELQLALHALLELRRTFLDYLFLGQRVEALVDTTPNAVREEEAAQLQQSYRLERDLTARMTIRQALGSLQRRIGEQTALGDVSQSIEHRLEMLEQALAQLKRRLAEPGCELLAPEIDDMLAKIGSAETLELAVDEALDQAPPTLASASMYGT